MFDKTWKKCIFVFVIIFVIVLAGGVLSINYLHDAVTNSNIHPMTVVVTDKYYGDGANSDYYLVTTDDNQTLSIIDHGDGHGKEMWQSIVVGGKYKFIVKEPELTDINQFTHIIQVYNATE